MDVREKLVELMTDKVPGIDNELRYVDDERVERLAGYLIANGVTVQEWISVKDRLPENRDDVLVCRTWWNETRNPHIGWYNDVAQEWQILDSDGYYPCGKVTYWMPLPEPPKGE